VEAVGLAAQFAVGKQLERLIEIEVDALGQRLLDLRIRRQEIGAGEFALHLGGGGGRRLRVGGLLVLRHSRLAPD